MANKPLIKKKQISTDLDIEDLEELGLEPVSSAAVQGLPEYSVIIDSDLFRTIKIKDSYEIYLSTAISHPVAYVPLISLLRALNKSDKVNIYINSPGGDVSAAIQIIHAIEECKAKVKAIIDGHCISIAPVIALAVKDVVVKPHSLIMFHDTSGGVLEGKTNSVLFQQEAYRRHYISLLTKTAGRVLSKKEILDMLDGKDFWLTGKEFLRRLDV